MRRKGRPRRNGPRNRGGRLKRGPAITPRQVAASQPHRRGLGELALDQRAETELGRMAIRGELGVIGDILATAGEEFARIWRGYAQTLDGPQSATNGRGRVFPCSGCQTASERANCLCEAYKRKWLGARDALASTYGGAAVVMYVAVFDRQCPWDEISALRIGLSALAEHFGLLDKSKRAKVQNVVSRISLH